MFSETKRRDSQKKKLYDWCADPTSHVERKIPFYYKEISYNTTKLNVWVLHIEFPKKTMVYVSLNSHLFKYL